MTWWQDDIRVAADALTEPSIHREPVYAWDRHRNRKLTGHHQVVLPGLLAQLHQSVIPVMSSASEGMPGGGKPQSRPPLAMEALHVHHTITCAISRWCTDVGLPPRLTVESDLRQLAAKAMSFDEPTARTLLGDLTAWRRRCLVLTGWEHLRILRAPCPGQLCGTYGGVRVNLTTVTAWCRVCATTWSHEDGTLHQLIEYAGGPSVPSPQHTS